ALIVHISGDKPGRASLTARLRSPYLDTSRVGPNSLVIDGSWKKVGSETNWLIATVEGRGLRFETALAARLEGGGAERGDGSLHIHSADAVTFLVTIATSYINYTNVNGDPAAICHGVLSTIQSKDYSSLRARHEADFTGLMSRVHLQVGDASLN